jgi:hypothetical protein
MRDTEAPTHGFFILYLHPNFTTSTPRHHNACATFSADMVWPAESRYFEVYYEECYELHGQ